MQINITARHLKITDAIDSYVRKKISKTSKFYDGEDVWAHAILSVEKSRQITEINFHIGKVSFRVKEQSPDLYASIDLAVDKLEKQLRKHKEISKIHRKSNLKAGKIKKSAIDAEIFSFDLMEDSRTKISEIKRFDVKNSTLGEAIEDMDVLGYRVYMFINDSSGKVNVLYRNDSGSVVLLEPEM